MLRIFFFTLSIGLMSCVNDDDQPSTNIIPGQYFFEIELAGETHRIQGRNEEMFLNGQNSCLSSLYNGIQAIGFKLVDITASDYVSGQPFDISIGIINPHVGNDNEGIITFQLSLYSSFLNEFGDQNNITFWQDNFVENSPMDVSVQYDYERIGRISNITITDLGSPPTLGEINSDNIEGSYEGTLYFLDDNTAGTPDANFNIPVPIRISFSALRGN